jgi:hypothetical protein
MPWGNGRRCSQQVLAALLLTVRRPMKVSCCSKQVNLILKEGFPAKELRKAVLLVQNYGRLLTNQGAATGDAEMPSGQWVDRRNARFAAVRAVAFGRSRCCLDARH